MFPVMTTGGGMCTAFPDVCKTPAPTGVLPIPYPNIAQCSDGTGTSKVKADGSDTLRKGDTMSQSNGDNAGVTGGVVSSKFMGKAEIKVGFPTVKFDGKEVGMHLTVVAQNGSSSFNIVGMNASPSQQKVKVPGMPGFTMVKQKSVRGETCDVRVKANKFHPGEMESEATGQMQQEAQTAATSEDVQKARQASERLGDLGAQNAAKKIAESRGGLGTAPPGLGNPHSFSGSGTCDVIAFCGDGTMLVMEAKGGSSPLGTAMVDGVGRCQQGTPEYMKQIAKNMASSHNAERRAAGQKLLDAIETGSPPVAYCEARTKYEKDPPKAKATRIREFDP